MISDEALTKKVREKLEDIDAIARLEQALSKEIVEEFSQELRQKKLVIRQQIKTQIELNEGDLEGRVDGGPRNNLFRSRVHRRASDRADREVEESREKRRLKGRHGGFDKLYKVSRELADFIGAPEITRRELTKFMFRYFKTNNLKDSKDRRYIYSNQILKDLLKVQRFHSFGFMKYIMPHIIK